MLQKQFKTIVLVLLVIKKINVYFIHESITTEICIKQMIWNLQRWFWWWWRDDGVLDDEAANDCVSDLVDDIN